MSSETTPVRTPTETPSQAPERERRADPAKLCPAQKEKLTRELAPLLP
jgi:hypothetical protein